MLEAQLRDELLRGLARGQAVGDGQREAHLHDPVAEVVGVRLDLLEVDWLAAGPRREPREVCSQARLDAPRISSLAGFR